MTKEHRYILNKGSKKHDCPLCAERRFVRYLDLETSDYLPDRYGRCDRESKCSYHLNPYADGYAKMIWKQERGLHIRDWKLSQPKYRPKPSPMFIPFEVFKQTLRGYEQNVFLQNLLYHVPFSFEIKDIERIIALYYLGTVCNGYRAGAITFSFRDKDGNVCAVQVKQFDRTNHTISTDFLHSIIK